MKKIMLTITYDGTSYAGWQWQPNQISIQQKIEEGLAKLYHQPIKLTGASRTDAGVHAMDQKACFTIRNNPIPLINLPKALNRYLPKDIVIIEALEKSPDFHPRYDAIAKEYIYQIHNHPYQNPLIRNQFLHVRKPLQIQLMEEGCGYLLGKKDFKGFCASNTDVRSTVREIYHAKIINENPFITLAIKGNGFLYNMIRIIMGSLICIGEGKKDPSYINEIIMSKDRNLAGKTIGPEGLILKKIYYE